MKHRAAFLFIIALALAALFVAEKRKADAPVRPDPILYFVADAERELGHVPAGAVRLTDEEEIRFGNELAQGYLSGFSQYSGETSDAAREVESYVNRVGSRVAAHAHRKLPYRFHYIPRSHFVNAFALPGGHVFVGEGLLELMDSEDELAAVLGHEIEHIDHYHCADRVVMEARLRRLPLRGLLTLPLEVFEAGYSKDQELEADREGTRLAVWASYSPLGAIRMFETFNRLYEEYVTHARTPQGELASVAIDTLQGYFRSHPLPPERIAQVRTMIADEHWGNLTSERPLEVAPLLWIELARRALDAGHYQQAAGFAKYSLNARPAQTLAWKVLGRADFALANFPEAATAYHSLLESSPTDETCLHDYADSLWAAGDRAKAVREFEKWHTSNPDGPLLLEQQVDLAGLMLAARDKKRADAVINELTAAIGPSWPPELDGRFGWWNYRAGNYEAAADQLSRAVHQRPNSMELNIRLGWVRIEQRNYEDALNRFSTATGQRMEYQNVLRTAVGQNQHTAKRFGVAGESPMGAAVAFWLARQKDEAMSEFSAAVNAQPEWLNPKWTGALYSRTVAQSVLEMEAERKRQIAAHRSH